MVELSSAVIAAVTALAVAMLTHFLAARREESRRLVEAAHDMRLRYLNPLRLHLVENSFRLQEIKEAVSSKSRCEPLLYVRDPLEFRSKQPDWFNREGAYLATSCYLATCLFSASARMRRDLPYAKLGKDEDTALLTYLRRISLGYSRDLGVFYVTQDSLGKMIERDRHLMTYVEFCTLLRGAEGFWFDRLVRYYLDTAQGLHESRVAAAVQSMDELLTFLERQIGSTSSLKAVLEAER
jgi:hypothetical protein